MSIFVDETTKVVIQGISPTSQGLFHGLRNKAYGTKIVGGTNPKRGGEEIEGIPVYASVAEAVKDTGATASFISVPPRGAADAIIEAAEAGISFIVCITEGIPAQDEAVAYNRLVDEFPGTRLLGPNCPGIISPGKCNIGITSGDIALPGGPVGIVSRSGTLTYQALHELSQQGIGQTTCVGIGGDPVPGTNFIDCLAAFEADPETKAVMMIGEIGGSEEERAAEFIASSMTKPVAAYIAGVTAPPGRKMGHAGAIISGTSGTAQAKKEALESVGISVGTTPTEVAQLVAERVGARACSRSGGGFRRPSACRWTSSASARVPCSAPTVRRFCPTARRAGTGRCAGGSPSGTASPSTASSSRTVAFRASSSSRNGLRRTVSACSSSGRRTTGR